MNQPPPPPKDYVVRGLSLAAVALALASMGLVARRVFGPAPGGPEALLNSALRQYVEGRPIVAGRLAASADLSEIIEGASEAADGADRNDADQNGAEPEVAPEEDAAAEDGDPDADGATGDAAGRRRRARSLKEYLIGAGHYAAAAGGVDRLPVVVNLSGVEPRTPTQTRREFRLAADHLSQSRSLDYPPGRAAAGDRMLGAALAYLGDYDEAVEPLRTAVATDPTMTTETAPVLAAALIRGGVPRRGEAVERLDAVLSGGEAAVPTAVVPDACRLLALEALVGRGDYEEVFRRVAAYVELPTPATVTDAARRRRFRDRAELWGLVATLDRAIDPLRRDAERTPLAETRPIGEDRIVGELPGELAVDLVNRMLDIARRGDDETALAARHWAARVCVAAGWPDRALNHLAFVRGHRPPGPRNPPAAIEELEQLANLGRTLEVVQAIRYLVRETAGGDEYDGRMVTASRLRLSLLDAVRGVRRGADYRRAVDAARAARPVIGEAESLYQEAAALYEWAESTGVEPRSGPAPPSQDVTSVGGVSSVGVGRGRRPSTTGSSIRQTARSSDGEEQATAAESGSKTPLAAGSDELAGIGSEVGLPVYLTDATGRAVRRSRFGAAGNAFAAAAKLWKDQPRYVETVWRTITAYEAARRYESCLRWLPEYVRYESRDRVARGRLVRGRALLALGEPASASEGLRAALDEHGRDPLRYDLRNLLARSLAAMGRYDDAIDTAQANLDDGTLTPDSPAWRESMFATAGWLHRSGLPIEPVAPADVAATSADGADVATDGDAGTRPGVSVDAVRLNEAADRLDAAARRYWPQTDAIEGLYLSAGIHSTLARTAAERAAAEGLSAAARVGHRAKASSHRQRALLRLDRILEAVESGDVDEPGDVYVAAALDRADALRDEGRLNDAVAMYRRVEVADPGRPVVLEAMVRSAEVLRRLGRGDAAAAMMRKARQTVDQFPTDVESEFERLTRFDRDTWREFLECYVEPKVEVAAVRSNP